MKGESAINKYLSKLAGDEDLEDEIEEGLRLSEKLYAKTREIWKKSSLMQKYSNLLKGIIA
jgi:hypothetical protein